MSTLDEMLAKARQSHESLTYLVDSTLAPSDADDARADLDALLDVMAFVERLEAYDVGEMDGRTRKFKKAGVVRHDPCGFMAEDGNDAGDLKSLVGITADHVCEPEAAAQSEAEKAKEALLQAYKDAVGMNVFDTKTWPLMLRVHEYVHALVREERDKVSEGYRNSGAGETPDLDALDHVARMIDPENIWGAQ